LKIISLIFYCFSLRCLSFALLQNLGLNCPPADGFKLDILEKLVKHFIKSNQENITLLDYLVQFIITHYTIDDELLENDISHSPAHFSISFLHELHTIEEAANIPFQELENEIHEITNKVKLLRNHLEMPPIELNDENSIQDKFNIKLSSFYNISKQKTKEIKNKLKTIKKECDSLIIFFEGTSKSMELNNFFILWSNFTKLYSKSEMKLVKQIKQIKLVEQMKQATSHLTITTLNRRDSVELSSEVDTESDYNK